MKIYFCHSRNFDFKNELYKPIRESDLNKQHQIIFPHESYHQQQKTKDIIKNCDLVLAEVSFPSIGLGIELGWANSQKIPIVCISKAGVKLSNSLRFITHNFIEYHTTKDLVKQVEKFLLEFKHIKLTNKNS